jgi:RNA ligase (TIGR02306 family)
MLDKIKSIKKINHKSKRYDIGVENVHNFYANDILVHNCQNLTKEYEKWKIQSKYQFYVTEKLDGSSSTFYIKNGVFGVCSRNLDLLETEENTFWKVARYLDLENKMKSLDFNLALQGELIGESIQGNPYKLKGQSVRFFTGFNIDTYQRMGYNEFTEILTKLNLESVPLLNQDLDFTLPNTIDEMLKYAEGKSMLNNQTEREGVVVRSLDGTISFKAVSNIFLLKNE